MHPALLFDIYRQWLGPVFFVIRKYLKVWLGLRTSKGIAVYLKKAERHRVRIDLQQDPSLLL